MLIETIFKMIGEKMKKIFKQLLPVFACGFAVGCSTTVEKSLEEKNAPKFSAEQLEFQRMIAAQEAFQIDAFREKQINNASLEIKAAVDSITNIEADLASFVEEKTAKKRELLLAAKELIAVEKKKSKETTLQDEYWAYVDKGRRLEESKPESKSMLNPMNWFSGDDSEESAEDAEFIADEYEIALKINVANQKKSEKAYENLQVILKARAVQILDQCKKEIAAIDKEIDEASDRASKSTAKAVQLIKDNEEVVERYSRAIEEALAERRAAEERAAEERAAEERAAEERAAETEEGSSFFGSFFSSSDEQDVVDEPVVEEAVETEEKSSFFGNFFSFSDEGDSEGVETAE